MKYNNSSQILSFRIYVQVHLCNRLISVAGSHFYLDYKLKSLMQRFSTGAILFLTIKPDPLMETVLTAASWSPVKSIMLSYSPLTKGGHYYRDSTSVR